MTHDKRLTQSHPTIWLCSDGKTLRAGDRGINAWFTVHDEATAERVVRRMQSLTRPQINAMSHNGTLRAHLGI